MARPREFDPDEALAKAMGVFWAHGYEGSSLPMLLDGMDLTRGSLYKAFKDKKTLFLAALERYEAEAVAPAVALLRDESIEHGLIRIEQLFEAVVETVRRGDRRGCLLCTAAAGPAVGDPDIAKSVHELINQMQGGFETALAASDAHRGLSPQQRAGSATMLMTQYIGLRILARSQAPLQVIEQSAASLLHLLRSQSSRAAS